MMSRNSSILVLTLFLAIGLFAPFILLHGQDSVPQGVIKVRRGPVPSDYKVSLHYTYHNKRGFLPHGLRRSLQEPMFYPPDPVTMEQEVLRDSVGPRRDSSFMITFYNKQGRPAEEFDWVAWLDHYEHLFEWDDTAGIDSTTFVFEINSRGQMKLRPIGSNNGDSGAEALQKNLTPLMKKLWIWYPAARASEGDKRRKKVACTVVVKVYAVKVGYDRNLPLEITN